MGQDDRKDSGHGPSLALAAAFAMLGVSVGVNVQEVLAAPVEAPASVQDKIRVTPESMQSKIDSPQSKLPAAQSKLRSSQNKVPALQQKHPQMPGNKPVDPPRP